MSISDIGKNTLKLDLTGSTNEYCKKLLKEGRINEGTVILADHQNKGKGQSGSSWESEKGKNLTFSIILFPRFLSVQNQFYIAMSVSTGIIDFLNFMSVDSEIKWPNDIYVNNKKIAGILIENSVMKDKIINSIIGVGININQEIFRSDAPNPTSLFLESGKSYDLGNSYKSLILNINNWINLLYSRKYDEIKTGYLEHLWLLNQQAAFTDSKGVFQGTIVDVEDGGILIIRTDANQIRKYDFREVAFPC